jgi:peptidoglycan L-alanyl-D-glutamate endopeptidase CwlK
MMDARSTRNLIGVHPDLVKVVHKAAQKSSFIVTEGLRTKERQAQLVKAGASQTMNSRHITGHAVDLAAVVNGEVRWDWSLYVAIANAMKAAALELNVPVRWGGTWKLLNDVKGPITAKMLSRSFPDGPHFELYRGRYP